MSRILYSRSNMTSSRPLDTARSRGMALLLFQRADLAKAPLVAGLVTEPGVQERPHQLPGQLDPDDTRSEHQHVHVVVLDTLVRGVRVVAQPGPDAGQLVGRDRRADAAAADEHAALRAALGHGVSHRRGDIGIVHRGGAVSAEVQDRVAERLKRGDQLLLEQVARVIGADGDSHRAGASWARAASTTWSTVKPNFFCSSLSGADAPKLTIPILAPVMPT